MKVHKSVADLQVGEKGIIGKIGKDAWALKLLELGCLPGTEVSLNYKLLGGPLCIDVCGHELFLLTEEAQTLSLLE
jgi:ferrous iron transport protein A